ncbi:hypothetical protein SCLCIDRAFT_29081 [Scleroderma citrinum Foug A]|uniref:Uncharacterized protein n=1 Tax=Scleroderma citrinum Foug A TaxID=1036808 RepID=A0A0C3D8U3_9AGAM|nr:hypothetical protein SCLCIDRAFT_29081 [Scleroderma citrinum Foug A]
MVKIPKLAEDGQNWKIYHAKFLEVAATFDCLEVLAGRPYEGEDWDGCNALLCCTFMESVPPSIYFKIRHRTAHENFKYLTKRFRDSEPIPCANELQRAGTATAVEMPENYPMSANTATEQHANAKRDEEDLSTTQDLTRGTEDINDRSVRRQDPRTSLEALAQGNSAKCTESTTVILESALHETQTKLQDLLPLTLRLPIEGEPSKCKQGQAESIMTAGRMNQMVGMAEPQIVDVDEMALLGRKPVERAKEVDKGDGTEHKSKLRLQETELLCKESHQHNKNANANIPSAYRLLLEGEWIVCSSSRLESSRWDTKELIAALSASIVLPALTDCPSESKEAEDTAGVKPEGCKEGMSESKSIDGTGSDAGREIEQMDTLNEPTELLMMTVEPYVKDANVNARICLGATRWRACDVKGPGSQADGLMGQADGSGAQTDSPSASNEAETARISHGEVAHTYLGAGDVKHGGDVMDGIRSQMDVPRGHLDVSSVKTKAIIPAKATEIISIARKKQKPPDLPMDTARMAPDMSNGNGNHTDTFSVCTDAYTVGNATEMPANKMENVRTHRNQLETRNSPETHGIAMPKPIRQWRNIVFGRFESRDKPIAANVKSEKAGDGGGSRNGDDGGDGGMDGTTSSGSIDSMRVEAALLAGESHPSDPQIVLSQTRKGEMTYHGRAQAMQPLQTDSKHCLKIEHMNNKTAQEVEMTHLKCIRTAQPPENASKHCYRDVWRRRCRGRIKIAPINVSQMQEVEETHLEHTNATQPPPNVSKRLHRVYIPQCRHGRIKSRSINAPSFMTQSLKRVASALQEFHDNKEAISVVPSIHQSGAVMQWFADVTEHAHVDEIKVPAHLGNNQNYYSQIARHLDQLDKCSCFDLATYIEQRAMDQANNDNGDSSGSDSDEQHEPDADNIEYSTPTH